MSHAQDPDRKQRAVFLDSVDDYPGWGAYVATVHMQEKMLSILDAKLPYYPAYARSKSTEEKAHWNDIAAANVYARFHRSNYTRPKVVVAFDANDFAIVDMNLQKDEVTKINTLRKKLHDPKFKIYEVELREFEDRLNKALAAELEVLLSGAKDKIWIILLRTLGENFKYVSSLSGLCDVPALLGEINTAMHSDVAHDKILTRRQLSAATFKNEGDCQFGKWLYYVNHMAQRLVALNAAYSDEEIVTIFLEGLPAQPFAIFRQLMFNSKDSFVKIAEQARAFASGTDSKLLLDQLYASKQRTGARSAPNVFAVRPVAVPGVHSVVPGVAKPCFDFARGYCSRSPCRYAHVASPVGVPPTAFVSCAHCGKRGHSIDTCFGVVGFPHGNRGKGGGRGKGSSIRGSGKGRGAGGMPAVDANAFMFNAGMDMNSILDAMEVRIKERHDRTARLADEQCVTEHTYMLDVISNCAVPLPVRPGFADSQAAVNASSHSDITDHPEKRVSSNVVFGFSRSVSPDLDGSILLDGGATIHATNMIDACFDIRPCCVTIGGVGGEFVCKSVGSLVIKTVLGVSVKLRDVFISPNFPLTFVSESKLLDKGCSILKKGEGGAVVDEKGIFLFTVKPEKGLFLIEGRVSVSPSPVSPAPTITTCVDGNKARTFLARAYSKPESSLDRLGVLHRRLQHSSFKKVADSFGLKLPAGFTAPFCEPCVMAKSANHQHHKGARAEAGQRYQGLHCDFCGPFPCESLSGARYILVFIDSFTGFIWDFYPNSQAEFFDIWHVLMARLDNEARQKNVVSWIRSDNAKVFSVPRVVAECAERGIRQEFSAPYSQWQNGKAERCFGTILSLAAASLFQSDLAEAYWEYAVRLAVLATNRISEPKVKNVEKGFDACWSKYERLLNKSVPTRLNGIYPFGCSVYKHIPAAIRRKFEHASEPAIYLGLAQSVKGVVVLTLKDSKRSVTASFVVHEAFFPLKPAMIEPASYEFRREHSKGGVTAAPSLFWPAGVSGSPVELLSDPRMAAPVAVQPDVPVSIVPSVGVAPRRSARGWKPTDLLLQGIADGHDVTAATTGGSFLGGVGVPAKENVLIISPIFGWLGNDHDDNCCASGERGSIWLSQVASGPLTRHEFSKLTPVSHKAALRGPHFKFWFPGELREVSAHIKNGTFGPVLSGPPPGFHAISMGFVYRNKCISDVAVLPESLSPSMFKVRAVVKGYTMIEGVDFADTFAPTPNPTSIRMMVALAVQLGFKLKVADIETAFLQSDMDKEVYVTMPAGYESCVATLAQLEQRGCVLKDLLSFLPVLPDSTADDKSSCRRLLKGVPGIKQGSRLFYVTMKKVLLDMSFAVCPKDPCVYWRVSQKDVIIIAV